MRASAYDTVLKGSEGIGTRYWHTEWWRRHTKANGFILSKNKGVFLNEAVLLLT